MNEHGTVLRYQQHVKDGDMCIACAGAELRAIYTTMCVNLANDQLLRDRLGVYMRVSK